MFDLQGSIDVLDPNNNTCRTTQSLYTTMELYLPRIACYYMFHDIHRTIFVNVIDLCGGAVVEQVLAVQ